jgi:carbamoyl-phosphate synthase small subunit
MSPRTGTVHREPAHLVLADGTVFEGEAFGAVPTDGIATGEAVFNTVLSGYQEVITDPSYAGQVIAFTYPHIGNYGVNAADDEAARPHCSGVIVRDLADAPSNYRSEGSLESFLTTHGVSGITGIDTRRLTRHLRRHGAVPCAFGTASESDLQAAARTAASTDGRDLVSTVTTPVVLTRGNGPYRVVAYDFGIKEAMLRQLGDLATVTVVPAATSADEVLALGPDGIFLSNGPGDPAALPAIIGEIRRLVDHGSVPIFGICLGHQLLASALGATTYKLPFGHHGGNHPVQRVSTGRVEITSQNHNYAVAADSLGASEITHVNLNDGVIEGLASTQTPAFSVQYHPEAGPGPHDARYLFEEFRMLMDATGGAA